jgi:hypothetical protein
MKSQDNRTMLIASRAIWGRDVISSAVSTYFSRWRFGSRRGLGVSREFRPAFFGRALPANMKVFVRQLRHAFGVMRHGLLDTSAPVVSYHQVAFRDILW